MTNKWIEHYLKMVRGELPYKKYYVVPNIKSSQEGDGDIKVVTPTQAAVEQAKMVVKRKLEEFPFHPPMKRRRKNTTKTPTKKKSRSSKKKSKPTKKKSRPIKRKSVLMRGGKGLKRMKKRKQSTTKSKPKKRSKKTIKGVKNSKRAQYKSRRSPHNIKRKLNYF